MVHEKISYEAVNTLVLNSIPPSAKRVLDVGCGAGNLGGALKIRQSCEVTGLTYSEDEAIEARERLDHVVVCDLNTYDAVELGQFDCIVCSHVLEHLYEPQELLKRLQSHLSPEGVVIVALPNILQWKQRVEFIKGRFRYTQGGLMDSTHFRFFDWVGAQKLVREGGFKIQKCVPDGSFPLPILRRIIPRLGSSLDQMFLRLFPGMFSFQFVMVAGRKN